MNAIEIRNLTKSFRGMYALDHFHMTVPVGSIYGFIGENGSGKSTTEKLICGHLVPDMGEIKLFGKNYKDPGVRVRVGALIENAGCFPNSSVYQNLMMQAINLGLAQPEEEIQRVLSIVRMEDAAKIPFKRCSLGMKQRIGIAMALLGDPALLILDEPINGLDTDGMRIMREILVDITRNYHCTVLISSHILGELEKIATHYGIIRQGKMILELSAKEMESRAQVFVSLKTKDTAGAKKLLQRHFATVREEDGALRVYDVDCTEDLVTLMVENGYIPYVKQLFTTHAKKQDYMISKSLTCAFAMASMCLTYLLGSVIAGLLVGASFSADWGGLIFAILGKMVMSLGWASLYTFLNVIFRRYFGVSVALSFFLGTGVLIIGVAAVLGNTPLLNVFLYGASVFACLSSTPATLLVCLVVSLAWTVFYNLLGSVILSRCDVY